MNVGPASSQIVGTTWRQGINYIKLNKKSKPVPYSNNGKPKIQKAPKNKIESNKQIGISKNIINNPNNQSKNRQQSSNPNNNRNANTRSNSSNDKNRREAPHSSEIYEIKSALSGMCLDIRGNSKRNGANIIQWPCNHKNNQRFEIGHGPNDTLIFRVQSTGLAVSVWGGGVHDLANMVQANYIGGKHQHFPLFSDFITYFPLTCLIALKC